MLGISPAAQRLRLHSSSAGSTGSIPGWGTKILHAAEQIQMLKRKKKIKKKAESRESNSYPFPLRSTHNRNIRKVNFRKILKVNCQSQTQQNLEK